MYVCIYIQDTCLCVYMYVYIHVCMKKCMHICMYNTGPPSPVVYSDPMSQRTYSQMYTFLYICTHVRTGHTFARGLLGPHIPRQRNQKGSDKRYWLKKNLLTELRAGMCMCVYVCVCVRACATLHIYIYIYIYICICIYICIYVNV